MIKQHIFALKNCRADEWKKAGTLKKAVRHGAKVKDVHTAHLITEKNY